MIISASRRTDIPAFFGDWFMNRIKAGWFDRINPFNPRQIKRVSLAPEEVEAIVFWTKNPGTFLNHLEALESQGYRFYFQFTLNDYPPVLEPRLPNLSRRIEIFRSLSRRIGPEKVLWRYDPIVISSVTSIEYHKERVNRLAEALGGYTTKLTLSFLTFYGKVRKRLDKLERCGRITFARENPDELSPERLELLSDIRQAASDAGMQVFTCASKMDLTSLGIERGACVDGKLIQRVFQLDGEFPKDPHQRKECLCAQSVDMGAYNTCRCGCAYCYANLDERSVAINLARHDVRGPSLIAPSPVAATGPDN
ncbi:MAG: DUF1848 domain-containing protein [Syntrophobacteraceae bacterium]